MFKIPLIGIGFFAVLFSQTTFALTLKEVFEEQPRIAEFKSSRYTATISEHNKFIKVGGSFYEIRYFMFQRNDGKEQTFRDFAIEQNIVDGDAKEIDLGFGPLLTFMPSKELRDNGFHYILSLAKRSDEEVKNFKTLPDEL